MGGSVCELGDEVGYWLREGLEESGKGKGFVVWRVRLWNWGCLRLRKMKCRGWELWRIFACKFSVLGS